MRRRRIRSLAALLAVLGAGFSPRLPAADEPPPASRLPLIERPSEHPTSPLFAVMLTGDGGWASIDRAIARVLNENGISVVGLISPKYLETMRSADELAGDLRAIVAHYQRVWGKSGFVLIGFSSGADLLPFAVSRLPAEARSELQLVTFLGLGRFTDFRFHLLDLIHYEPRATSVPLAPELEKLRGLKLLFLCGDSDSDSIEHGIVDGLGKVITMHGDHHLGGDFALLGRLILENLEPDGASRPVAEAR